LEIKIMEMFTITGKRNEDLKKANNRKLVKSYFIGNDVLYGAIAEHLGIAIDGLNVEQLKAAINEKNAELACVGVDGSMVEHGVTIVDKMAANLNKPIKRCDRVKVQPPIKRPKIKASGRSSVPKPVLLVARSPMAKALKMALN
jgi:hypothetical protein